MAWGRLALLQAAGQSDAVLHKMAAIFGYAALPRQQQAIDDKDPDMFDRAIDQTKTDPQTETQQQRPPARFLRVNKITRNSHQDDKKPDYLTDPKMNLNCRDAPVGRYSFAASRPLLNLSRLGPFLRNALGQPVAGRHVDHTRLARYVAQGKVIHRLPCLPQQRWPQRLHIIVDVSLSLEPYWGDFAFIIKQLKSLLGKEAVDAIRFIDSTSVREPERVIAWPAQDRQTGRTWQVPPADVPILILTDLGMAQGHYAARIPWLRLYRRLHYHPAPVLTLSPASHAPADRRLCRKLKPNPLNDQHRLRRHPQRNGFSLSGQNNAGINDILALLSPLPLIDAGLLRRLRNELEWGSSDLESQLWNHRDVRQTSLGIRLHEQVAEQYRQRYQQLFAGTGKATALWRIVRSHHEHAFEGLQQLERLNQSVLEGKQDTDMRQYFKQLCASLMQAAESGVQRKALLMQCQTVLASRPQSIWTSQLGDIAYDLYAAAYADEIRAGRWPDNLEAGFQPAKLQWVLDAATRKEMLPWQIEQNGVQAQFTLQISSAERRVYSPVARFEAQQQIPPALLLPSQPPVAALAGQQFEVPEQTVFHLQSASHQITLECISKPAWACAIGRDADGLWTDISWADQIQVVRWEVSESGEPGAWAWQAPFGQDEYGLYADLVINEITQRFRWIEPGTFVMGSPEDEPDREWIGEGSEIQHEVLLTQGFWLADTTVTQALWHAVMGKNPSRFKADVNNPVEQVSWQDAQAFINGLHTDFPGLRLPTEAQWEYACRAGTMTPFSFGNNLSPQQANYDGNHPYPGGKKGLYREKTLAVKSLPANPWGLYQMHGNVWEWCEDAWRQKLGKDKVTDPCERSEDPAAQRVVRGGSWDYDGGSLRSAMRIYFSPDIRFNNLGLRLALGHLSSGQGGAKVSSELSS